MKVSKRVAAFLCTIIISFSMPIINLSAATTKKVTPKVTKKVTAKANLTVKDIVKLYDNSVVIVNTFKDTNYKQPYAQGSGFSLGNGLICTNYHVIEGAKSISITANNQKEYQIAGIVKYDAKKDLAILKCKSLVNIKTVKLGSYKNVSKADNVVAIGSPEGLQNTVSTGIVSGFRKTQDGINYIQITVPITYGSSGGPLFDMKGNVIGVTSMGVDSGNLNFAVAIDNLTPWMKQLSNKSFKSIAAVPINSIGKQTGNTANTTNSVKGNKGGNTGGTKVDTGSSITPKVTFDISLNFQVTDVIMNPSADVMYITDKNAKKLYSVDCKTKKISSVSFTLAPESICYKNGKVYVALLKKEHNSYIDEKDEQGAIAVVDGKSMKIENQIDVDIDPFDIEVLDDNYIIISSGSGQFTSIKCYSLKTKQEVSSSSIRQESYIEYNPFLNRVYTIDTDVSPRDYYAYNISEGKFTDPSYPGGYDSPYHGDYPLDKLFRLSPDGKYIFNASGIVFACDYDKSNDMKYAGKLNKSFIDIAFNGTKKFYTGIANGLIYEYNYSDFQGTNTYNIKAAPVRLFYRNNQLIVLETLTQNNIQKYGIEIVKLSGKK